MRPPNYGMDQVLAAIFALTAAGCLYGAFVNRGDPAWMATGVAFALVFLLAAWALFRSVRPPRLRGVELHVEPLAAAPGDTVAVTLAVERPQAGTVQVGLLGSAIVTAVNPSDRPMTREGRRVFHEDWREVTLDGTQRLRFTLPSSAAATRHTPNNVRIGWEVMARRPARLRPDRRLTREIAVAPRAGG